MNMIWPLLKKDKNYFIKKICKIIWTNFNFILMNINSKCSQNWLIHTFLLYNVKSACRNICNLLKKESNMMLLYIFKICQILVFIDHN